MPILLMDLFRRLMPWLITLTLGLGAGAYLMKRWCDSSAEPTKTEKVEKESKSKTKTKKTTVIKRPDGTTETVTEDTVQTNKSNESSTTKQTAKAQSKVKVGAQAKLKPWDWKPSDWDYGPSVSVRAIGPIWVDAGWYFKSKEATLGVSWEF